jgi:osmotically-inducible protein OsmY
MDFGGGYGGGEDRGGGGRRHLAGTRDLDERWGSSWDRDRAGSRGGSFREEEREARWRQDRGGEPWRYEGGTMRGGAERERWAGDRDRDRWAEDRERGRGERERSSESDQGPGGGYPGGWGGERTYGSSTGGYGASGLTGSTGRWERGGAGYIGRESAGGGGFGGGGSYGGGRYGRGGEESYGPTYPGEFGAQGARSDWRRERGGWSEHRGEDDRGFMEKMGDTFREGMAKLTGRGPKGYRRSDDRVREEVCERIARSDVNAENVEVQVENGEVTLSGEVENRRDKRRLEDLIEDVFGVDEVRNHLRLRRETASSHMGAAQASSTSSTQSSSTQTTSGEASRTRTAGESDDAGLPH